MPIYDRLCSNDHLQQDVIEPIAAPDLPCPTCQSPTRRVLVGRSAPVFDDSIPGGVMMENAICNLDGTPKRYDSHSDIKRAYKAAGLEPIDEHRPMKGSDKGKMTTNWAVGPPPGYDPRPACMGGTPNREIEEWEKRPPSRLDTDLLPMDEAEFAMRREMSLAELSGVTSSVPNSEKYYLDNRDGRR